ncbi:hypothetical protein KKI24_12965 [bacterium]|nr:hypothetical protein [bacterium]
MKTVKRLIPLDEVASMADVAPNELLTAINDGALSLVPLLVRGRIFFRRSKFWTWFGSIGWNGDNIYEPSNIPAVIFL